ncbi:MAG: hypothetical protein KAQ83_01400 [Nanoarchaeota archaeon]|nr:hypothetical protein [Nanoarchaeota archaeon]
MKSKYSIIFILAATFLLSGCSQETGPVSGTPFIGGTTGLVMSFVDGAPPEEVYDGDYSFTAVVKVENVGESDIAIGDARINIRGISPENFGTNAASLIQNNNEDLLSSKKNPEGGTTEGSILHFTFPSDGVFTYVDELSGTHTFPFLATMCYNYQNKANAMICVKEDPLDYEDTVCIIDGIKTVYNSGGPIQIMNFEETPRGKTKLAFTFEINHQGTGEVYEMTTMCEGERATEDKVYVNVNTGIPGLECTGFTGGETNSGYITLYEGKRSITCTQDVSGVSGDYEKIVEITTDYDYEQSITTQVTVKHAAE